jgi:hypothetical protein
VTGGEKMTSLSDDQLKYARYKWEFLRRNPEYINDWQKLEDTLWQKYGDYYPPSGEMSKEEIEFCMKWKIGCQIPPEKSYDDFTTHIYEHVEENYPLPEEERDGKNIDFDDLGFAVTERSLVDLGDLDLHRIMFDRLFPEFIHWRPFMVEDGWEYEYDEHILRRRFYDKVAKSGILTIKIDLNHSKNRLINDFKGFINEWKKMYEKALANLLYEKFCEEREIRSHPIDDENLQKEFEEIYADRLKERKEKYESKYHFDNYDLYLQVHDLRQEGKSWSKIANELNLNSVQTARNHYNAARELIDKGIELYVK